jgi:uroporphyrinogen III methyltransferase/synthase
MDDGDSVRGRPLAGKRVLVPRPRHQAADLVQKLEALGAVPLVLPLIEILPPDSWAAVDDRIARLGEFDWLVFTSANGVRFLFERMRTTVPDAPTVRPRLAAIGPSTAEALTEFGLKADLVPAEYRSESLAAALAERAAGRRILLARADRGRDILFAELSKVADVDQVVVYRQTDPAVGGGPEHDALCRGEIDFVTLTSANVARALVRSLDPVARNRVFAGHMRLVTISPVTSAAVKELGFAVAAEARDFTADGLIAALVEMAAGGSEQVAEGVPRQVQQDAAGEDADDVDEHEHRAE